MIPREHLGTAHVPGGEELRLFRHGRDFVIALHNNDLMSTRMSGSEESLATLTIARLGGPNYTRVTGETIFAMPRPVLPGG